MSWNQKQILDILDAGCEAYTFPMLDNGYVYLAATRMSLYRSENDWAMVLEVFGFSARAELPDTHIHTFASTIHDRNKESNYVHQEAYWNYLAENPHNESRFIHPVAEGSWQDKDDTEFVNPRGKLKLRGRTVQLPSRPDYEKLGIAVEEEEPRVFELCRFLAGQYRDDVLCTESERRVSVLPEMEQILLLDEWYHPDVVDAELPSQVSSFQQLADVLATRDITKYSPQDSPNTNWSHWPDGGIL